MKQRLHPLCVALLALVLCNTPLFAEDFAVDGIYYDITSETDKTVEVTYRGSYNYSYSDEYSGAVTIPESVTYSDITYSVTSIGASAFYGCSSLTSVEIPNSVTSIGDRAFYDCSGLTSVEIPNSVTSIGYATFLGCSGLTSVEIPNSVTSIGDDAFRNCSSLTSVVIPNSVTSIGSQTFFGCSSLTSVEIPNSVTSIGSGAFSGCSSLTSIAVAENNQTYDSRNNCNAIIETQTNTLIAGCSETTIPNSVTSIGSLAFSSCSSLTSVVIPNSVTSIGSSAFSRCSSLNSVEIPNSVTSIGSSAFSWCSRLTSVEIPNSVTSIGDWAFEYCFSLTSVEIPNSVIRIGSYAFSGCSALTTATVGCSWKNNPLYNFGENVTVNATLHSYENGACKVCGDNSLKFAVDGIYYYITSDTDKKVVVTFRGDDPYNYQNEYSGAVTIPEFVTYNGNTYSVTSIGERAFSGCSGLISVEIPNSVTSIGNSAFFSCDNLTSVDIPNSVTSIESRAFGWCPSLTSVVIPNSITAIGDETFYYCSGLTSVEIPNSVTAIGDETFYYCSSLTSVEIPNSVTAIGVYAFGFCSSLTSVEIPNSVTSIGKYAFSGCSDLTSIVVAEDNPIYDSRDNCNAIIETQTNTLIAGCSKTTIPNSVPHIGSATFYNCFNLTSVKIPNSVTSIGDYAFYNCSGLTSVEIPNSVTSIGYAAFEDCSALTTATVGCSWKNNPLYDFGENVTVNATLHSYENGVCKVCGEASEDEGERIELVEGTPFENEEAREVAQVTYNRTLPNLEWNALYLPVEIPVAALSENYDLAYFNNMHAYDRNNDGAVDEMDMEVFLINEGTLHANYPYFIRAKREDAKQLQLVLTDVVLHAAEETSLTCSSVFIDFALTGVYARNDAETLSGCYAINTSGAWSPIAAGSYLNPFRCYLKMTNRDGSPVKVDEALQTIRIRVKGEGETTGIADAFVNGQQPAAIYDLQGRRVMVPQKGKIYIVGGKKKVF